MSPPGTQPQEGLPQASLPPEATQKQNPEAGKILELDQVEKATQDKLANLKSKIDVNLGLEDQALLVTLMDEGKKGLLADLQEMGLSEEQKTSLLAEYEKASREKLSKIGEVLDSKEYEDLEGFFKKLIEKLEGFNDAIAKRKFVGRIDGIFGNLNKLGENNPLKGWTQVAGADLYDTLAYIAAFLKLPQLFGVPAKKESEMVSPTPQPKQPETFEGKSILNLFADATKTDDFGKRAKEYLANKLSAFGTLVNTEVPNDSSGKMILKDMKDPNKNHTYLVENNTLTGKLLVKEEGGKSKGVELAGSSPEQLATGLTELNKLETAKA